MRKKEWFILILLVVVLFSLIFMTIARERSQQAEAEYELQREYERSLTIFDETLEDIIMDFEILIEREETQDLIYIFSELESQLIRLDLRLELFSEIYNEIDYFPAFKDLNLIMREPHVSEEGRVKPVIFQGQKQLTTSQIEFLKLVKSDVKKLREELSENETVDVLISPNKFNGILKEMLNKDYITIYVTEFAE